MPSRVTNPPPCRHCGEPVQGVTANSDQERWYHGDECARVALKLKPGPIAPQSHDDLVRDGLEYP